MPAILRARRAARPGGGRGIQAALTALALAGSALSAVALGAVVSAGPALAVPAGSEYPSSWVVTGNVATGTTPSGVVVTATLTGPAAFFSPPTGTLVDTGSTPAYIPATDQGLLVQITECAVAPCGSITYSFSQPVVSPVLYLGDVGTGASGTPGTPRGSGHANRRLVRRQLVRHGRAVAPPPVVFTEYHDSPLTLASGTFSLDSAGSQTPNMSIQNAGTTVGITDPLAEIGQPASNPTSCGTYGCGAYDIATPTQTVTSITLDYGYAGTGITQDVFGQLLGISPVAPALTLRKSVTPRVAAGAGTRLTFSYLVTNSGNVTLTDVHPADTEFTGTGTPSAVTCPGTVLDPGQQETCTARYTLTQADADAGKVTDTAVATGTQPSAPAVRNPAGNLTVSSAASSATVTIPAKPALVVDKSASPATFKAAGTTIHFRFLVTNTGNVTITRLKVRDRLPGLSAISCPTATLNPGRFVTCTASYVTTEADLRAGAVPDTAATASGDPPAGSPVVSPPSRFRIVAPPARHHPGPPVPVTG